MKRLVLTMFLGLLLLPFLPASGKDEVTTDEGKTGKDEYRSARERMVEIQIQARGINDPLVLRAMEEVPRHLFIPEDLRPQAYEDHPVRIGEGQTISQPYIVALMTDCLNLEGTEKVLEIGTGSGYQAAVLAEITDEVFSVEIREALALRSRQILDTLGYTEVQTKWDDGYYGWIEHAPFHRIIITAAVDHIPPPLLDQLIPGGIMVLPLGDPYGYQQLVTVEKTEDGYTLKHITGVLFVPMTGQAQGE